MDVTDSKGAVALMGRREEAEGGVELTVACAWPFECVRLSNGLGGVY